MDSYDEDTVACKVNYYLNLLQQTQKVIKYVQLYRILFFTYVQGLIIFNQSLTRFCSTENIIFLSWQMVESVRTERRTVL